MLGWGRGRLVVFKNLEPNAGDEREAREIFNPVPTSKEKSRPSVNEGWRNFVRISCGWGCFYYDLLRNWDDFFSVDYLVQP